MASVNKVHLLGNIGRDLELRYLPNGDAAAGTSLATSSKRKDKNTGEVIEDTQWHRIQFFGKTAEIAAQYLRKGSPVYVEGRLKYGKYTDQAGVEKPTCEIVVSEMQLLGGGGQQQDGHQQAPQQQPQRQAPQQAFPQGYQQQPQRQAAPQRQQPPQRQAPQQASGFEDMGDDIPF